MKPKKPREIKYTREFLKSLAKVPKEQVSFLQVREKIFRQNIFDPRLKTHRLKGKLTGFYSFSTSYHWRIVFHFEKDEVVFDIIGTHKIYR